MSYWGNHSSLYRTIPPDGVKDLEAAIRFRVRGDYKDAQISFTQLGESVSKLPVTLIEHSILYERMGLEQERLRILNVVEGWPEEGSREPGADEWDLLNLLRVNAEWFANGKLKPAPSEACHVAARLKQKKENDFSDLEVSVGR